MSDQDNSGTGSGEMANQLDGLAGWFMKRLRTGKSGRPRLELMERITIGPRQTVALIEAEGQRLLVACAAEGRPAIYPLGSGVCARAHERAWGNRQVGQRVSW
jgi:hypothetical protein